MKNSFLGPTCRVSDSGELWGGLRVCISFNFFSDSDAVGLETTYWPLLCFSHPDWTQLCLFCTCKQATGCCSRKITYCAVCFCLHLSLQTPNGPSITVWLSFHIFLVRSLSFSTFCLSSLLKPPISILSLVSADKLSSLISVRNWKPEEKNSLIFSLTRLQFCWRLLFPPAQCKDESLPITSQPLILGSTSCCSHQSKNSTSLTPPFTYAIECVNLDYSLYLHFYPPFILCSSSHYPISLLPFMVKNYWKCCWLPMFLSPHLPFTLKICVGGIFIYWINTLSDTWVLFCSLHSHDFGNKFLNMEYTTSDKSCAENKDVVILWPIKTFRK